MLKQENVIEQIDPKVEKSSLPNLKISKFQNQFLFCPFCSSENSFNLKRMRCTKCDTIVCQAKTNKMLKMSDEIKNGVYSSRKV